MRYFKALYVEMIPHITTKSQLNIVEEYILREFSYNFNINPNNSGIKQKRGKALVHETEKRQIAEKIWLHYFNQELHKRNLISTLERNKMALKIESRQPSAKKKNASVL